LSNPVTKWSALSKPIAAARGNASPAAGMASTPNLLLAALPADVLDRLMPNLELVDLPLGKVLYESGVEMKHVFFPISGCIISMLYVMADGSSAEIAVVGDEPSAIT
jgi:hypothetical protein